MEKDTCEMFIILVLYQMDKKWRKRFEEILQRRRGVSIHAAFYQLHRENMLGTSALEFHFDALYGVTRPLQLIVSDAVRNGLIRMDGSLFWYHLDALSVECRKKLMRSYHLDEKEIVRTATRLDKLLAEQEQTAAQPATTA